MMPMSAVYAPPIVDHNVGTKLADQVHQVIEHLWSPNFFRFFGRLRKTEVPRAGEIEFHAVATRGGQQFLRSNQSQLRRLFWPQRILSTFASRQWQQRDISVQSASEISK